MDRSPPSIPAREPTKHPSPPAPRTAKAANQGARRRPERSIPGPRCSGSIPHPLHACNDRSGGNRVVIVAGPWPRRRRPHKEVCIAFQLPPLFRRVARVPGCRFDRRPACRRTSSRSSGRPVPRFAGGRRWVDRIHARRGYTDGVREQSTGNDANSGLSTGAPQAHARGRVRPDCATGTPTGLLLKAGDTWLETFPFWAKIGPVRGRADGGSAATGPVRGRCSRPARPRPFATAAYVATARAHLVLTELHFWAHTNDGTGGAMGIDITNGLNDVLIENCWVEAVPGEHRGAGDRDAPDHIKIRRSVVTYSLSTTGFSTGPDLRARGQHP